jgi:hypothetical protein
VCEYCRNLARKSWQKSRKRKAHMTKWWAISRNASVL